MKKVIIAVLAAASMSPLLSVAHQPDSEGPFTNQAWQSYGLTLHEDKEAAINTVRFDQQRQRFDVTVKYIAKLPAELQSEMAKEMAAIDDAGDKAINELLSPEERAAHAKLKVKHEAQEKLWAEFEEWKKNRK